jgi:SAM-dependent methyltransferase
VSSRLKKHSGRISLTLAHYISGRNRERKWELFLQEFSLKPDLKVLDVGFSDLEFSPVDNYLEKHYPYPQMITAISIYEPKEFPARYPQVKAMRYDGNTFPFEDNSFDICWSNAVIEHVGGFEAQLRFTEEMTRVGKAVFFTTPNRYFPIEPHTRTVLLHYLPKAVFDVYLGGVGKSWATGNYMHLLGLADLRALLRQARIKNYKIIKNRLLGLVLDYVVVIKKSLML